MANRKDAERLLRTKQPFKSGNLTAQYPHMRIKTYPDLVDTIYVVKSYALPIAVFDGDVWHLLDSDFNSPTTNKHINWVRRVIGTNDAYSEYPVVPTKAAMVAFVDRLCGY